MFNNNAVPRMKPIRRSMIIFDHNACFLIAALCAYSTFTEELQSMEVT
jgi:hypothetical protein